MNALDLARWQFAITTIYHFIFVPLSGKMFLINFAVGVVTGIVQVFQFGMNWSAYSTFVGDAFGAEYPQSDEGGFKEEREQCFHRERCASKRPGRIRVPASEPVARG